MSKRQQEELRRLEEALMESDYMHEVPDFWEDPPKKNSQVFYNTDDSDVDLDEYSEEIHRGSKGNGLSAVLTMLAMLALSAGILLLLKMLGVL